MSIYKLSILILLPLNYNKSNTSTVINGMVQYKIEIPIIIEFLIGGLAICDTIIAYLRISLAGYILIKSLLEG